MSTVRAEKALDTNQGAGRSLGGVGVVVARVKSHLLGITVALAAYVRHQFGGVDSQPRPVSRLHRTARAVQG